MSTSQTKRDSQYVVRRKKGNSLGYLHSHLGTPRVDRREQFRLALFILLLILRFEIRKATHFCP